MEFLEAISDYIGPWIWLLPVPLIIFSATPRMPFWYKSGRILFMWLLIIFLTGGIVYSILSSEETYVCCLSKEYIYMKYITLFFVWSFLLNVYIGWWEFLWRCVYRQWTWPLLKNVQYGLVSNLCILGSAVFTVPFVLLMIAVQLHKLF